MPRDVFTVYVDGVIDEDDEVAAVRDLVKVNGAALVRGARSAEDLVQRVILEAVRASARRVRQQTDHVVAQVREETKALVGVTRQSLKPVTKADEAARRAARIKEAADGQA